MSAASDDTENVCDGDVNKYYEIDTLANDYASYLHADDFVQTQQFDDGIEELLTKLDEYHGLLDMIRSDTTLCLQKTIPSIRAKTKDMEIIFDKIDKLEVFVSVVKKNMSMIEEKVSRAEAELAPLEGFRKVFSAFPLPSFLASKPHAAKQLPKYEAPDIYSTKDFITSRNNPKNDNKLPSIDLCDSQAIQSGSLMKAADVSSGVNSSVQASQVNMSETTSTRQMETDTGKQTGTASTGAIESISTNQSETMHISQSGTVPGIQVEDHHANQNEINSNSNNHHSVNFQPNLQVQNKSKLPLFDHVGQITVNKGQLYVAYARGTRQVVILQHPGNGLSETA